MTACFHHGSVEAGAAASWARNGTVPKIARSSTRNADLRGFNIRSPVSKQTENIRFLLRWCKENSACSFLGDGYCGAGSFFQLMNRIDSQAREALLQSARPAHFHEINFVRLCQPEMHSHVAAGRITRSAAHFVNTQTSGGAQS